jgi:hypothetical protein
MRYFPELCLAIRARDTDYRKQNVDRIEHQLSYLLRENPPPSFAEVTRRLEYSRNWFSRKFPEKIKVIERRHRDFKKNLAAQKKSVAKARIRRAALDLCGSGIYPSQGQICRLFNEKMGVTTAELTVILREIRIERGLSRLGVGF